MAIRNRDRVTGLIQALLLTLGVSCLGYYAYVSVERYVYQRVEDRELNAMARARASASVSATNGTTSDTQPPAAMPEPVMEPPPGSLMGRIEIERLDVSAIVLSGSDETTLRRGVGHIPGTSALDGNGNIGLAAHRDTFFRPLRNIRNGDIVKVTTPDGTRAFKVESAIIVDPTDVWVLDQTDTPTLTLVTCYPFNFVGHAPRRFIVRAVQVDSTRDPDFVNSNTHVTTGMRGYVIE